MIILLLIAWTNDPIAPVATTGWVIDGSIGRVIGG